MSEIYGSWLNESFDYKKTKERLDSLHTEFFPKYEMRVEAIYALAQLYKGQMCVLYPHLASNFDVAYHNVLSLCGRYFNDIVHYKVWHDVSDSEKAKMVAHMVKWAFEYPPVVVSLSEDEYKSLDQNSRTVCFEHRQGFIDLMVEYILLGFRTGSENISQVGRLNKIFYLLETGQYDVKNATLIFREMFN